jgi:hypothetical protein
MNTLFFRFFVSFAGISTVIAGLFIGALSPMFALWTGICFALLGAVAIIDMGEK